MSDKDITTSIDANDDDVIDLKKSHYAEHGGQTKLATPTQVSNQSNALQPELLNILKMGKRYAQFQGLDRCIRILDIGLPHQRHCMAMMVKNLTMNQLMCTNCDRIKDPNANPKIINSSMIRLSKKELEECGLEADPLVGKQTVPEAAKKAAKKVKTELEDVEDNRTLKRPKVKKNIVNIEISMEDLKKDPNVVNALLQKTLDAIYELPVSNFREAEEIRVVKEKVESFLTKGA